MFCNLLIISSLVKRLTDNTRLDEETTLLIDLNSLDAQSEILKIQGNGGIWYVGAWLGYGFHEDGLMSAIKIAKEFKCLPSWLNDSDLNSKDC